MVACVGKSLGILTATVCTLGSSVALAEPFHEDPPSDTRDAEPERERWYGWQTLSVDALPAGLFVGALASDGGTEVQLWGTGALTFALGGPLVHVLHDRPLTSLGSLGLRVGLPALGMAIGLPFASLNPPPDLPGVRRDDTTNGALPLIVGGLLGAASASALDAGLLAYDPPSRTAPKHEAFRASPLGVTFRVAPRGGDIAVLGVF
jgi:hypothetical protein